MVLTITSLSLPEEENRVSVEEGKKGFLEKSGGF